jgi:hypothetical protein
MVEIFEKFVEELFKDKSRNKCESGTENDLTSSFSKSPNFFERRNYFISPRHKRYGKRVNFQEWRAEYTNHLQNLFSRLVILLDSRYENENEGGWNTKRNFEGFCHFIFNNSSKTL